MHPKFANLAAVFDLAAAQGGVVSTGQLRELGATQSVLRRLTRDRVLHRVIRGVLSVDSTVSFEGRTWVAILLGGPGAVIGGAAAGYLAGLKVAEPDTIVTFVGDRDVSNRPGWVFVRSGRRGRGDPPRTEVADTVLELCSRAATTDEVVSLLADAIAGRRTSVPRLRQRLAELPTLRRRALIAAILGEVSNGVHSPLERRYARDVEAAHGLPRGRRQVSSGRGYRGDVLYEECRLLVELDGRAHHLGRAAIDDVDRDNAFLLEGVSTLRLGWRQVVGDPCGTALLVGEALSRRGWSGVTGRCRRCRRAGQWAA